MKDLFSLLSHLNCCLFILQHKKRMPDASLHKIIKNWLSKVESCMDPPESMSSTSNLDDNTHLRTQNVTDAESTADQTEIDNSEILLLSSSQRQFDSIR